MQCFRFFFGVGGWVKGRKKRKRWHVGEEMLVEVGGAG